MGYLQLGSIAAHQKAVVAFWFRVPAATIAAATAMAADDTVPFAQKIPLLCWGKRKSRVEYNLGSVNVLTWHSGGTAPEVLAQTWTSPHDTDDFGPCFIAVNCRVPGWPYIEVHIQTDTTPTIVGHSYVPTSIDGWSVGDVSNPYLADPSSYPEGGGYVNFGSWTGICNGITDQSFVLSALPARFDFDSFSLLIPPIAADQWHQIIISFDMSDGVATHQVAYPNASPPDTASQTTASARAWFSLDDVNIKMSDASGTWVDGGGDNDIITDEAWTIANQGHTQRTVDNRFTATATHDLTDPLVGAGPVGIPGSSVYVSNILTVEMFRPQVFTGVTLDTSVEANRRLFIGADGKPVKASVAAAVLGQPKILFKNAKDFKAGKNTGSLGGTFTKTGTINNFTPDPGA